jgi:hypothetical protein
MHDFPHQDDQLAEFRGLQLALEGSCMLPQDRVAGLHDGRQVVRGQQLLHGFPDAGGAVSCGRRCVAHGDSLVTARLGLVTAW